MIASSTKATVLEYGTRLDPIVIALRKRALDELLTSGFASVPEADLLAAFRLAGDPAYRPGSASPEVPRCRCGNAAHVAVDAHGGRHVHGNACKGCTTNAFEGL